MNWHFYTTSNQIEAPFTEQIVLKVLDFIEDKSGYHIFTDCYFTSIDLPRQLMSRGMGFTGIINSRRKGLPEIVKTINDKNPGPYYLRNEGGSGVDFRKIRIVSTFVRYGYEFAYVKIKNVSGKFLRKSQSQRICVD